MSCNPRSGDVYEAMTPHGRTAHFRHTGLNYLAWTGEFVRGGPLVARAGQLKVALANAARRAERHA